LLGVARHAARAAHQRRDVSTERLLDLVQRDPRDRGDVVQIARDDRLFAGVDLD